ncbi:hypothetical protein P6P90_15225 [Ectobacillus antri]|uniref:Uncharacterized protein n=1 Tax=Ectobacillus antri TaxID=2486280 RepID=A0ABT6H976_9BACI|nr:hypothetical protein [Ectobacillus antri]MDG4658211.1 hypothetical protein [Ectobacillus antri]MDG5755269.1 hypothetical protein [Ectobacillus antri]
MLLFFIFPIKNLNTNNLFDTSKEALMALVLKQHGGILVPIIIEEVNMKNEEMLEYEEGMMEFCKYTLLILNRVRNDLKVIVRKNTMTRIRISSSLSIRSIRKNTVTEAIELSDCITDPFYRKM